MQNEKFYRMLGLATRAGKVVCGGKAKLVIVAKDASENTMKKFCNSCEYYSVPQIITDDRFALGEATGKGFAVVMAVCDESFAKVILGNAQ